MLLGGKKYCITSEISIEVTIATSSPYYHHYSQSAFNTQQECIYKALADFCKFDNFSRFFRHNSAENCQINIPKEERDPSQYDLNLSSQNSFF